MTLNEQDAFDRLLADVLRERANPATPNHLEQRLHAAFLNDLALNDAAANDLNRGSAMTTQTLPLNSLLWAAPARTPWNVRGLLGAAMLHVLLLFMLFAIVHQTRRRTVAVTHVNMATLTPPPPPVVLKAQPVPARPAMMAGGGGAPAPTPVTRGTPPRVADQQILPAAAPALAESKIMVDRTVVAQPDLKMDQSAIPQLGMPNAPMVGRASAGGGRGTGFGSGIGSGLGEGTGGNYGGGLAKIGGGVSSPEVLYKPEAEFSEEARKAKLSGNVLVGLVVDEQGRPRNVHIVRGLGLGLDEKAVAAVKLYRFKPAIKEGRPVAVAMNVEIYFQIL